MQMETSTYRTIQLPFTLNFREMSKKELKADFQWFQEIMPERVAELTSAVKSSPGYEDWKADFSPNSLNAIGEWFTTQMEVRLLTQGEIDEFNAKVPYPIEQPDTELTNRTFSLAIDIGMYLSQVFLKNHPTLKWDQPLGGKRHIDYGQPVLVPFYGGKVPLNPVGMVVGLACGLLKGTRKGKGLREFYDLWSKAIG